MKETGVRTKHTERENFGMSMAMSSTVNGLMIKLKDTVSTFTPMGRNTRDTGKKTYNTGQARKSGQMGQSMTVNTITGKSMGGGTTNGLIKVVMMAIGWRIR